ncbi:amidohydrolase family protein [Burkholderiaceae bacterium FT117]|uniref:N-acyl-D-amino-acid deacylase family protein n=1 Tax=Zeimonas sediminis TaxID=2944268 RepID=UPI0023430D1C|nr:amidohydrolase family protein [Zeimonas sediminis]MCM5572071.1 amidohydrolase family protein [Zeimonas sediminis]
MNDLLIRGAMVYDGTGAPGRPADVSVKDGRIAAIDEPGQGVAARETVDADGLALMPGIVDNHTHYDAQVTWDPFCTPSPSLGVTTAVIGNCGFTIAPCRPGDRELIMRNLTQVEGMSLDVLRQGIDWQFETIPEYLDFLERRGSLVNLAAFVGHSSLRTFVMGEDAPKRAATDAEIARMRELVLEGMKAGAIGFATSTSPAHNGEGGLPMPSRLATDEELHTLVASLKEAGRGLFMLTKGGHTKIDFLEKLAVDSGRPVVVAALLHNSTNPTAVFADLDAIEAARQRGRRMIGAISPCPLTNDFTMHSPYPVEGLASWKPALSLKGDAFKAKLADKAFRDAVRAEIASPAVFRLFNGEWHKVQVVEAKNEKNRRLEHRTIAELAAEAGADPLDFMLDLALSEDLDTVFSAVLLNSDEEAVGRMLRHPASLVSLSDAGAHLTFFNDAGFGLHLLGHWVRERGVLSLPEAIRKLTSEPAELFGIQGRGRIAPGAWADLMLFDPATVDRGPKQRVFDLPGGGARLTTPAIGVHGVWVNGVKVAGANGLDPAVVAAGKAAVAGAGAGKLPGKLLREFAA